MAKNDIKEIEKAAEEVANEVIEETTEMQEKAVKSKSKLGNYVETHWKGWVKNALIFTAGALFKTGLDYVLGTDIDVDVDGAIDTTATEV